MKKYLPINRILLTLLIVITIGIVIGTYLANFQHNPPVEFKNLPFPVITKQVHAGDDVLVEIEYCRYVNVPFDANVSFIDGMIFYVPVQHVSGLPVGCGTIYANVVTVPKNLPVGTYSLTGKNEYKVNFLATRVVEWSTETFEVIP